MPRASVEARERGERGERASAHPGSLAHPLAQRPHTKNTWPQERSASGHKQAQAPQAPSQRRKRGSGREEEALHHVLCSDQSESIIFLSVPAPLVCVWPFLGMLRAYLSDPRVRQEQWKTFHPWTKTCSRMSSLHWWAPLPWAVPGSA